MEKTSGYIFKSYYCVNEFSRFVCRLDYVSRLLLTDLININQ